MASNKFFQNAVVAAATLSVAVLAGCPGTPTQPTGSPSAKPSGAASPTTPASPTSPTAPSSPASGSAAPATPAPTSIPSTPDTSARATIHGIVFDDGGASRQRLNDVTVTGKILGAGTFANGSDTLSVSTQVGSYALNGAPTGQTVLVTVTKNGYTTRQKTIVPLANLQGDPSANKLSFGEDSAGAFDETFAMSDKPEVTSMTPKPDSTGVDPATTFTLTWSEPVNKNDVEDQFAIAISNDNYSLSSGGSSLRLVKEYESSNDSFGYATAGGTFATPTAINPRVSRPTYDSTAFTPAWSNNDQTVTFTFRPGFKLPTDKDSSRIPQFAVGFKGNVKDAASSGTRSEKFFRVSAAQIGKNGYRFTVAADTTAPRLNGVTTVINSIANTNEAIRYQFSETMVLYPASVWDPALNPGGADIDGNAGIDDPNVNAVVEANVGRDLNNDGDMADTMAAGSFNESGLTGGFGASIPRTAAANTASALSVNRYEADERLATDAKPALAALAYGNPGAVALWDGDTTNATIRADYGNVATIASGDTIWGGVQPTVEDPAGNAIDTGNAANVKSSRAI